MRGLLGEQLFDSVYHFLDGLNALGRVVRDIDSEFVFQREKEIDAVE